MVTKVIKMTLKDLKKHSVRYENKDSADDTLRLVYLMKEGLPKPYPKTISVEISSKEGEDNG